MQLDDFIVSQLYFNMFRASLRPSSGGQTAFSLHMFISPVKVNTYEVLCVISFYRTGKHMQ